MNSWTSKGFYELASVNTERYNFSNTELRSQMERLYSTATPGHVLILLYSSNETGAHSQATPTDIKLKPGGI